MLATLSSKGQITLPKKIRDNLHLKTGDKLEFILNEEGRLELIPVTTSVKQLKGMVPPPKRTITLEEMDNAIQQRSKEI